MPERFCTLSSSLAKRAKPSANGDAGASPPDSSSTMPLPPVSCRSDADEAHRGELRGRYYAIAHDGGPGDAGQGGTIGGISTRAPAAGMMHGQGKYEGRRHVVRGGVQVERVDGKGGSCGLTGPPTRGR